MRKLSVCLSGIGWMVVGPIAWSQDPGQTSTPDSPMSDVSKSLNEGRTPAAATVERIMEQAVRNIGVRYNLNEAQAKETADLMRRDVYRFLKENENEVWPVIRDLLSSQLRTPNDLDAMMRVGKAARPLLEKAAKAIFRGNDEWRSILTPDQQRMHEFDMEEMQRTFKEIDERFHQWEEGKGLANGPIFENPDLAGRQPGRPERPEGDKLPSGNGALTYTPEHIFETIVKEFIRKYDLKQGQITAAKSILEEFKIKAVDFHNTNRAALAKVGAEQENALRQRDVAAIKKAAGDHKELLRPVYLLADQMQDRLKGLLETGQIDRHEGEQNKPAGQRPAESKSSAKEREEPSKSSLESSQSGEG